MKVSSSIFSLSDIYLKVKKDPTAQSLLLSNLVTIVLAVLLNWNLIEVLWVYWGQSVIIGLFNFLKMLKIALSNQKDDFSLVGQLFVSFFFLIHYNGFHLAYLVFLVVFSFLPVEGIHSFVKLDVFAFVPFFFITMVIFFINHLFSFLYYSKKLDLFGIDKNRLLGKLMFRPYARIIPMHLTIIFGTMIMFYGMFNLLVLVLFLLLKTFADINMHISEHKEGF